MKKFLSFMLTLVMLLSIAATASAATFNDVPANHWANKAIEDMAAKGIVNGTGNGKFSPNDNVTGAEFIAMVTRSFYGEDVLKEAQANGGANWSAPYLATATNLKLLDGVAANNQPMNRAEMAGVIYNFLVQKNVALPTDADLAKVTIPDIGNLTAEQQKRITVVYALGYLKGVDNAGNFKGNDNMNRAEAATVISRLMEKYPTEIKVTADQIEKARTDKSGSGSVATNPTTPTTGDKPTADAGKAGKGNSENTVYVPASDVKIPTGKEFQPQLSDKGLQASGEESNGENEAYFDIETARYVILSDGTKGIMKVLYANDGERYYDGYHRKAEIIIEMNVGDTMTFNCKDFGLSYQNGDKWAIGKKGTLELTDNGDGTATVKALKTGNTQQTYDYNNEKTVFSYHIIIK